MINIKNVLMLSVSCLTFMATKDVHANLNYNINSREFNLDTKHIYTHAHLVNKHLSSAYYSSPMAFNLRGGSIAPSGSNLSTSNFPLTASVCFVTDTEDCKGMKFESPDAPYDPDPDNRCKKEGYLKTSCDPLYEPYNYCPYDRKYWEKCICKSTLISCNAPNIGVGPACDGKYEKCCKNECPAGYDLSNGSCRQASSLKTACGNACYKILNNTCSTGSLNPPAETGGNKNKVVATTECGNSCWQSFNDNCPSGYVTNKASGKCYETTVSYTPYGSACYKEKPCCDDSCSGYKTIPTSSQCPGGYNTTTTGCNNRCYTCKTCYVTTCEYTSSNKPTGTGWSCTPCKAIAPDCSVISKGYNCTYNSCDKPEVASDCSYKGYLPRYDGGDVMRKGEYVFCCDNSDPICEKFAPPCSKFTSKCSGTLNLVRHVTCCGGYDDYSMRKCE